MVSTARKTLAPFGGRASVELADAARLPFGDNRFDLVLSAAMLHHVVRWEEALAEARGSTGHPSARQRRRAVTGSQRLWAGAWWLAGGSADTPPL